MERIAQVAAEESEEGDLIFQDKIDDSTPTSNRILSKEEGNISSKSVGKLGRKVNELTDKWNKINTERSMEESHKVETLGSPSKSPKASSPQGFNQMIRNMSQFNRLQNRDEQEKDCFIS